MLTHGELFAGIGGFGLGFDRAGMETKWHVEIDKNCQVILKRHFPDTPIFSDVRDCGKHNLSYVDVISFGSPCQDLSVAGRRKGLNGQRSGLFFEAIRIVDELKPLVAVWENVPGALSSNDGRDFAAVLGAFRECGARDIAWRILDAQYFGLAQRRNRLFLIADFRNERAAQVLFESQSVPRDPAESRKTGKDVAYAVRADPSHSGDKGDGGVNTTLVFDEAQITSKLHKSRPSEISQPLNTLARMSVFGGNNPGEIDKSTTLNAHGGTGRHDFESETFVASTLRSRQSREGVNPPGRGGEDDSNLVIARPLAHGKTNNHGDESQQTYIIEQNNIASTPDMISLRSDPAQPAILAGTLPASGAGLDRPAGQGNELDFLIPDDAKQVILRLDNSFAHSIPKDQEVIPSVSTGSGHNGGFSNNAVQVPQMGVRRLTPTECERLQGFPDGWTGGQSDSVRYRQLGNAVAVPVVEWIGRRIVGIT